jgi:hypothetical protein
MSLLKRVYPRLADVPWGNEVRLASREARISKNFLMPDGDISLTCLEITLRFFIFSLF